MRPALNDRQIARMGFRIGLFQRRGMSPTEAEALADRLADRDHDLDDRRCCLECSHLQRGFTCFALKREANRIADLAAGPARIEALRRSWARGAHPSTEVHPQVLHRCVGFAFVTP